MSGGAVTAFAPGSVGNVGPGLDILGLAVAGDGDAVRAEWLAEPGIRMLDPGHPELPREAERHTAGLAARAVLDRAGPARARGRGIGLSVRKGLPLSGGQGGSAASAVAGAVAVNALLGDPLGKMELIEACLDAEEAVAGRHADNIAPSLLGGIVLIRSMDPLDVVRLPVPAELYVVLARPEQRMRTAEARAVLPREVSRAVALHQAAHVAAMVAALALDDYELLGRVGGRPHRRAGARRTAARLRRGEGRGARRGRAGQLDLGERAHRVRAGARARERRAHRGGHGGGVPRAGRRLPGAGGAGGSRRRDA